MIDYERSTRRGQIRRLRQVAERALSQYDIELVSLSLLNHVFNTTFLVVDRTGARFVLHVLRALEDGLSPSERRVRVESELWWLDGVREDLQLPVPSPVRTPDGQGVVSVALSAPMPPRLCTLFHWVPGRSVRHRLAPVHLEAVGRITARLHDYSANLDVPRWFDRPRVDRADAETEADAVRLFSDAVSPQAAGVVSRVLRRARQAENVLGHGPDTFGLIHADIHQNNYLFSGNEVRLIDFGDCGWGHYLYDLAVTISELAGSPRQAELAARLVAGYRQARHLPSSHEALIDAFVALREAQNLTWFVKARRDPTYQPRAALVAERVAELERRLELDE